MPPADGTDVLKPNFIQIIPTGIYDYFQMASVFFDRVSDRVFKFSMSSQDGCGTTFMAYLFKDNAHKVRYHSYFDDQGDSEETIAVGDFVFYDTLPLFLRFNLATKREYSINPYMNFNGTAGVWRKRAIADGGGWKWDTLTE